MLTAGTAESVYWQGRKRNAIALHYGALMAIVSGRKTQQDGTALSGLDREPGIRWSRAGTCNLLSRLALSERLFLNALPSSRLRPDACHSPVKQGDIGRALIQGGLVGGIEGRETEIRLKIRLPADNLTTEWTIFFS
jgi:hypothetical protein